MRRGHLACLWLGLAALGPGPVAAAGPAGGSDSDILYLDAAAWRASAHDRKVALSAAFMRVFCTDLRMAPERLVECLDRDGSEGPMFSRSLACASAPGGS